MNSTVGSKGRRGNYSPVETRKALLNAAIKLFDERGYHATPVEEIVVADGVTKGALYHHFSSKEDMLLGIQDDYISDRLRNAKLILDTYPTATERLRRLVHESLSTVALYRGHVTIFMQEQRFLRGERFAAIKTKRDEVDAVYQMVIQQGVESGEFRPEIKTRIAGFAVLGTLAWAYYWYQPGGQLTTDEVAEELTTYVLRGLQG